MSLAPSSRVRLGVQRDLRVVVVVSMAHAMSHFCQMLVPLLSQNMTQSFGTSFTGLGFVITLFFVTSCSVQAISGFVVDRKGPRPVLIFGLCLIVLGILGFAVSTHYWMLLVSSVVMGLGNGVFHPADYTLFNRLIEPQRLGYAYGVHGISGSLGWALAPMVVPVATLTGSWRVAMLCAALLVAVVLVVVFTFRGGLSLTAPAKNVVKEFPQALQKAAPKPPQESSFAFLKLPVIWMCMLFFFFYALNNSAIQTYAAVALQGLFGFSELWAASCITFYMLCSAGGMLFGGFLARDPSRCERIIAFAFGIAAFISFSLALLPLSAWLAPIVLGVMGFSVGIAGPSRDLIVKRSTPPGASGRVFGVVYAGLDIGQALAPVIYGRLMDHQNFAGLFLVLVVVQGILIASAFNVSRNKASS